MDTVGGDVALPNPLCILTCLLKDISKSAPRFRPPAFNSPRYPYLPIFYLLSVVTKYLLGIVVKIDPVLKASFVCVTVRW